MNLVPWPQSVTVNAGELTLTGSSRVTYTDPGLADLAQIVADEIEQVTRLQLGVAQGAPAAGDIDLAITADPGITGEDYRVTVGSHATAEGEDYQAIAMATVTILQAIKEDSGNYSIPQMRITDAPDAEYRGLMVDVARNYHSIDTLKEVVVMCRLYKIRYLQIHLTDDQSFTFPSTAYPDLTAYSWSYSLAELQDLVAFADARGVTLVPEVDIPGHATSFVAAMPALFASDGRNVINFGKDEVRVAMKTIIDELCSVFQSSPYIHLGADEVSLGGLDGLTEFQTAIATYGVGDINGLFNHFISDLDDRVKFHGKNTIVWEGFDYNKSGAAEMDTDISVMMFDNYKDPASYLAAGHPVINTSWYPLYVVGADGFGMDPDLIYAWDKFKFANYSDPFPRRASLIFSKDVSPTPTPNIPGGQMCSWEMPQ
ncbi:MAG: family 20 glycosylhydrolase, partial [Verrucomicrobiota bacterium]